MAPTTMPRTLASCVLGPITARAWDRTEPAARARREQMCSPCFVAHQPPKRCHLPDVREHDVALSRSGPGAYRDDVAVCEVAGVEPPVLDAHEEAAGRRDSIVLPRELGARVFALLHHLDDGNRSACARRFDVSLPTPGHWIRTGVIRFDYVLRICWRSSLRPTRLLLADIPSDLTY